MEFTWLCYQQTFACHMLELNKSKYGRRKWFWPTFCLWIMCSRWLKNRNDIILFSAIGAIFPIKNNWLKYLNLNCFQEKSWVLTFKSFLWLINTLVWWNLFCRFRLVFILIIFFIILLLWRIGRDISYSIVSEKKSWV